MEKDYDFDLMEALEHIDPSELNYQEWVHVGMGLKEAGYTAEDWDRWSCRDASRYHRDECFKKWSSFRGAGTPITGGTIVQMSMARGWHPRGSGCELNWDDVIGEKEDLVVVNKNWVEGREVVEPTEWEPVKQLITYLETLFHENENVGYVTRSFEKDGKHMPERGCYDRTAGKLIRALRDCGGDVGSVLGDYNPAVGAWIRFNPLDGRGIRNENVIGFRYALVESDSMDVERQSAIIHELELPVACLVHSGGKSLHAIVRVDAADYNEYRHRVDYLYTVCRKNGLEVDQQNRNPSRLSRLPGVIRNAHKQFLIGTNLGKSSWEQWREWIESISDDLPDPESMADTWNKLPDLSPPLIEGLLRQGHKMLLAGPSKAGKSFALIELCCAIAEGRGWLTWRCTRGRVLYVNLELDRASCLHRFHDVYTALGWPPMHLENLDVWNLRGKSVPMDKLAPKLIRRAAKKNYIAIVIDPIYKVITGDENSADQMAHFCNQFDKVCTELGCAVVYCHHHSKGSQGGKRSMDRASGSGVFARDPDALLDLIELDISEDLKKQEQNKAVAAVCAMALREAGKLNDVSQDDLCSETTAIHACERLLSIAEFRNTLGAVASARRGVESLTAWRVEGTLREFPKFTPVNMWFDYPTHRVDQSGVLNDIGPEDDRPRWQKKGALEASIKPPDKRKERLDKLSNAFSFCDMAGTGEVTIADLAEYSGVSRNTTKNYVDEHPDFERGKDGTVRRVPEPKNRNK